MTYLTDATALARNGGHAGNAVAAAWRAWAWLRIPAIETWPRAVAFAQTIAGKILLTLVLAAGLAPFYAPWTAIAMAASAGACAFAGRYRSYVVTAGTFAVLITQPAWFDWAAPTLAAAQQGLAGEIDLDALRWMTLLAVLIFSAAAFHATRVRALRRPVLSLLIYFFGLTALACSGVLHGAMQVALWGFLATLTCYFWFICYALQDSTSKAASPFAIQAGTFHPFWGSSATPFGKGAAYIRKVEAKTPDELAVTQLKGLKLLIWSYVLRVALLAFRKGVYGVLAVPTFPQAFAAQTAGHPLAWHLCWASIIAGFIESLLQIAGWGHLIVACARFAGFGLLRNTYRPLEARTLAEFWNRYYFYFKELLVDLFFYPTFLRCFKRHPRLRIAFATFIAAGVGNMIYHFMREIGTVAQLGLTQAVIGYQTYAFYCTVLALGICASQLRGRKFAPDAGWLRGRVLPCAGVALFFILLHVFDDLDRTTTLADHLVFLFRLFGIDHWGWS